MDPYAKTKSCCENCKWYLMIDSAYGYCRRFPPTQKSPTGRIWFTTYYEDRYPIVVFDNSTCGEFLNIKENVRKENK